MSEPEVSTMSETREPCGHGWHWGAKCDEAAKPEVGPMRDTDSPSGVQALGSSGPSLSPLDTLTALRNAHDTLRRYHLPDCGCVSHRRSDDGGITYASPSKDCTCGLSARLDELDALIQQLGDRPVLDDTDGRCRGGSPQYCPNCDNTFIARPR
jgi:hypothetical protein